MTPLLLGGVFVVAAYFLLKWYTEADTKTVKSSARWLGVLLLGAAFVFLAATGRLAAAFAVLAAFAAWAWRIFNMIAMARQFTGMFGAGRASADDVRGPTPPPRGSAMTEEEALRILGLARGASAAEIKTAYRRLMGQVHPDHGGTDYLAAKINQAKDLLLRDKS